MNFVLKIAKDGQPDSHQPGSQMRDRLKPCLTREELIKQANVVKARIEIAMMRLQKQIASPGSVAALDKLKAKNSDLHERVSTILQALQSNTVDHSHLGDHGIDDHGDHECEHHMGSHIDDRLTHDVRVLEQKFERFQDHRSQQSQFAASSVHMGGHGHHNHLRVASALQI